MDPQLSGIAAIIAAVAGVINATAKLITAITQSRNDKRK